jgi:hypothetical protein
MRLVKHIEYESWKFAEVTCVRRRTEGPKAEQWKRLLAQWQKSGMSQAAFCQQEHLNANTFTWWKISLLGKENLGKPKARRSSQQKKTFVPVIVEGDSTETPLSEDQFSAMKIPERIAAEISSRDGNNRVRIFDGASPATVAAIIGACFKP